MNRHRGPPISHSQHFGLRSVENDANAVADRYFDWRFLFFSSLSFLRPRCIFPASPATDLRKRVKGIAVGIETRERREKSLGPPSGICIL